MAAVWPPSLPQAQELAITVQPRDYTIASSPDMGPQKVRNRYLQDALTLDVAIPITLTGGQMQTFLAFLITIANQAGDECLVFDWEHPVTDAPCQYRLQTYPAMSCARGGDPNDETDEEVEIPAGNRRVWRGVLNCEIVEIAS